MIVPKLYAYNKCEYSVHDLTMQVKRLRFSLTAEKAKYREGSSKDRLLEIMSIHVKKMNRMAIMTKRENIDSATARLYRSI